MSASNDAQGPFRDEKNRWRSISVVRRVVVLFGSIGMIAGAGLLTAGFALASGSLEPGNLSLSQSSGTVTQTPTWSTTDGCPSGFQGSAALSVFNTNGSLAGPVSPVVASPTAAFQGTLTGDVGSVLASTNITNGGTVAMAVGCYSQASAMGSVKYVQLTFVQLSSDGTSFSTASTGPSPSSSPTPSSTSPSANPRAAAPLAAAAPATATPTTTPTSTPTATPTSTPTSTVSPSPSSTLPSGGAQTGAGGAALPGGGNTLLIALGAMALAGSAAAVGLAVRNARKPAQQNWQDTGTPGPGL